MKNLSQFVTEARSSAASQEAKRLGLVGDGHGGWYNRATGEFEAKTVSGKLEFFNKRQVMGGRDSKQTAKEKQIATSSYNEVPTQPNLNSTQGYQMQPQDQNYTDPQQVDPTYQTDDMTQDQPVVTPPLVEKIKDSLTIAFGRFNPPTIGHQQLMDTAYAVATESGGDYIIVPSRSFDKKKNPLDPDTKISYMRKMFPEHSERIVNDVNFITIFDVLKKAHNDGYANVNIVSGSDRLKEFEKLSNNYNGQLYQFDTINLFSSGERDPDGKGIDGVSASRMRLAAAEGDFITFREILPKTLKNKESLELFYLVRQGMGIQEIQQEGYNKWEIAPELDSQQLRENYIEEKIYKIGDIVENLNTGLVGKIIRRGTNYLICVTENGMMFKSWIKDVSESCNGKVMSGIKRVSNKRNKKNPMKTMKVLNIENFINRNRKK